MFVAVLMFEFSGVEGDNDIFCCSFTSVVVRPRWNASVGL